MAEENVKNITTEKVTKKNLSTVRLIVGGIIVLVFITILCLFLIFTCVIKLSPSGMEIKRSGIGVEIVKYTGDEKNLKIPDLINGLSVVSIGEKAFYNTNVEKVEMPKDLKEVGSYCFANCKKLKEIKFNSKETNFGQSAFEDSSVKKVTLPTNLQKISKAMFKNCKNLTSVSFPNKLLYIDDEAFYGCTSLSKMTIGEGIRKIGKNSFDKESSDFMLCSVTGSMIEDYARENNIEYAPCNEYYEVYTKYPVYVGSNPYSTVEVSNGRNGIMNFYPPQSGYYRVTLKGNTVSFDINKATEKTQKLATVKNNPNDYFAYFDSGKEYFLSVTSQETSDFTVNIEKVSKATVSTYSKCEKLYGGESTYDLAQGTELRSYHSVNSGVVATVNSYTTLYNVQDYYVDNKNKVWYQITTKIGARESKLWFKA